MNVIPFPGAKQGKPTEGHEKKVASARLGEKISAGELVKSRKEFFIHEYCFNHNASAQKAISKELLLGKFRFVRAVDLNLNDVKMPDGITQNTEVPCLILEYAGGLNMFKDEKFKETKAQRNLNLQENEIALLASDIEPVKKK